MISCISSLEIISVVREAKFKGRAPDRNILLWIAASVADAAAVNPNRIETLLANGLITFPIKCNPVYSNGSKSLHKIQPYCPILCNWVFDNFTLAEELFAQLYEPLKLVY